MVNKDDDLNVEEEVVLDEEEQIEEESIEESDASEEAVEEEPESDRDEDEEDRIVTIGDSDTEEGEAEEESEEKQEDKADLVKKLRKVTRGLEKKNKALKRQIEANERATVTEKPVELGVEPTLASCKYDEVKFKQDYDVWKDQKRKVEAQAEEKTKLVEEQNKVWQGRKDHYIDLKQEHKFKDFDDAEELVQDTFSVAQQSIIVQGADDAALLVYALGKNPKKLEELSKVTNPVDFAFKVAKLESQLKVTNRKAPKPEKRIKTGKSGGISGSTDKTLERLMTEADRTGDRTKVVAYKRKLHKG